MILSMSDQATYFVWTVLMGAAAGVLYDVFRVLRKTFKHPDFLTQAEDLVYWILVAVFLFYFILHTNSGEVRVFAIIGVFAGMAFYFAALSRLFMKIALLIVGLLQKSLSIVCKILAFPFLALFRLLRALCTALLKTVARCLEPAMKLLQNIFRNAKISLRKARQNLKIMQKNI